MTATISPQLDENFVHLTAHTATMSPVCVGVVPLLTLYKLTPNPLNRHGRVQIVHRIYILEVGIALFDFGRRASHSRI